MIITQYNILNTSKCLGLWLNLHTLSGTTDIKMTSKWNYKLPDNAFYNIYPPFRRLHIQQVSSKDTC